MADIEVTVNDNTEGKKSPDKWEIERWACSIVEAEEIKADPEKMKYVEPVLKKKREAIEKACAVKSIDDLKKKARALDKED